MCSSSCKIKAEMSRSLMLAWIHLYIHHTEGSCASGWVAAHTKIRVTHQMDIAHDSKEQPELEKITSIKSNSKNQLRDILPQQLLQCVGPGLRTRKEKAIFSARGDSQG